MYYDLVVHVDDNDPGRLNFAFNNVAPADLWEGCEVVPAGVVEIVKLQREGFAYLRP